MWKISAWLLGLAWFFTLAALYLDIQQVTAHLNLFQRMGSVLTLCAVMLEFTLNRKMAMGLGQGQDGTITIHSIARMLKRNDGTKLDNGLRYFAHITLVIGTAIWGFGDLIFLF